MKMKPIKGQFRQGDVLLHPVAAIPADATDVTPKGRIVLAHGEVTGHTHAIAEGEAREFTHVDARLLTATATATVTHEEHAAIPMPPGIREIVQQRAYSPERITAEQIETETNAEVRRVMIERYDSVRGAGAYLKDSGAQIIAQDEGGILYRKNLEGDEPMVMVRVLNSTPEPDGVMSRDDAIAVFGRNARCVIDASGPVMGCLWQAPITARFKEYMIRVHPQLRPLPRGDWSEAQKRAWLAQQKPQPMTPRNAIASTFGLRGEDYAPEIET
jgi:hypothetical protein